jgi:hypothetical protein
VLDAAQRFPLVIQQHGDKSASERKIEMNRNRGQNLELSKMYLTLLALPLSTFCCLALFGRFIGPRGCILLSGFSSISCTLISIVIFYQVALNQSPCHISLALFS